MKKKEMIFFLIILVLAGAFCIFHFITQTPSAVVSVSIDGTEYKQFDLSKDQYYTIQTPQGYNTSNTKLYCNYNRSRLSGSNLCTAKVHSKQRRIDSLSSS